MAECAPRIPANTTKQWVYAPASTLFSFSLLIMAQTQNTSPAKIWIALLKHIFHLKALAAVELYTGCGVSPASVSIPLLAFISLVASMIKAWSTQTKSILRKRRHVEILGWIEDTTVEHLVGLRLPRVRSVFSRVVLLKFATARHHILNQRDVLPRYLHSHKILLTS